MHRSRSFSLLLFVAVTAAAAAGTVTAAEHDCDPVAELEQIQRIAAESPYAMSYQGPFPRSSQGISATAYLDDGRVLRALRVEYLGEVGRSRVRFRFRSRTSYTAAWEEQLYETSIYDDPSPTVRSSREGCLVVEDGSLRGGSGDVDPGDLEGLEKDLDRILSDHLPCAVRFADTGTSSSAHDDLFEALLRQGREHLSRGELDAAVEVLRAADRLERFEVPGYEALLPLAEALCRRGDGEAGRAALDTFACAVRVDASELPCFVAPSDGDSPGAPEALDAPGPPNPDLPADCFQRMCGEAFLAYYEDRSPARLAELAARSAEAERLGHLCRPAATSSTPSSTPAPAPPPVTSP